MWALIAPVSAVVALDNSCIRTLILDGDDLLVWPSFDPRGWFDVSIEKGLSVVEDSTKSFIIEGNELAHE